MNELEKFKKRMREELGIAESKVSIHIAKKCSVTEEIYDVLVDINAYSNYLNGAMAMECFPELTVEQTEFVISGTTPAEWNKIFKKDEESTKE